MMDSILNHIKKMIVPANNKAVKCVDGGYRAGQAEGAIAFPGGHLGLSMALVKLGFSADDAFNIVHEYVVKTGSKYCWHTDTHADHSGAHVGCGHCNAAINTGHHYGVEGEEIKKLLELVKNSHSDESKKDHMELVILDRDHIEKAILVIDSKGFSVKPWDEAENTQFFVYDKTRHMDLLQEFVEFLIQKGYELKFEDLAKASEEQTNSTLGLLGSSKGKEIYVVKIDEEGNILDVSLAGNAPVIN